MKTTDIQLSMIDELGALNEQIKVLEARTKQLKADIADQYGEGNFVGQGYTVKITLSQRETVNAKKLIELCKIASDDVVKCTSIAAVITVKTDRIG
jgi:uncharacterized protein (UPF0335 family)